MRGSHWRWTILDQPHLPCDSFLCSKSEIEEQLHAMQLIALQGERISLVSHDSAAKQSKSARCPALFANEPLAFLMKRTKPQVRKSPTSKQVRLRESEMKERC